MNISRESRENLKKYYQFVKTCKLCKEIYGYDFQGKGHLDSSENGVCPICEAKLSHDKRVKSHLKS